MIYNICSARLYGAPIDQDYYRVLGTRREPIYLLTLIRSILSPSPAISIDVYMIGRVSDTRLSISQLYTGQSIRVDCPYCISPPAAGVASYRRLI